MIALMISRTVAELVAFIVEIESKIFAGVSFLLAVAEGPIERVIGFQFVPTVTLGCGGLWNSMFEMLVGGFRLVDVARALDWRRDCLANHAALLHRRCWRCARARTRGPDCLRELRVIRSRLRSGGTDFCGNRIRIEHVAASRTLEGRRIVGQDPLVNPIPGMTTGTLNFYHSPTSQPARKIIIPHKTKHLPPFRAVRPSREGAFRCE
jgi:hypothetical protein